MLADEKEEHETEAKEGKKIEESQRIKELENDIKLVREKYQRILA